MLNRDTIVGVCGAGAMGAGIAQIAAQAGHPVIVLDQFEDALSRGRDIVAKGLSALVKRSKISQREADGIAQRCRWTTDKADLGHAGLVIEAIVEDAEVKRGLFRSLEEITTAECVLATNTSSLSVTGLGSGLKRPARFLGLHFFNPAPVMKLVEVVRGAVSDPAIVSAAHSLMQAWGKVAVEARDVPGFIVNRVARPFYGEGWRALEEGAADAATLDFLYRDLAGFRMGPFELGDLIGHDVNTAAAKSIFDAYYGKTRFTPSLMQGSLAASGRLGRKSGEGVYSYKDEKRPEPKLTGLPASGDPSMLARVVAGETIEHDGAFIAMSDGRTASGRACELNAPVALIDHVRDSAAATAIAFAASDAKAAAAAVSFAARCGKSAARLVDRPGLVVLRTMLQLANCAADAVRDRVATADAVDLAMLNGVNYPVGPLEWARQFGHARAVSALDAIADEIGEPMYRPSEWLRAAARRDL